MPIQQPPKGARSAFLLAMTMTIIGVVGAGKSFSQLQTNPHEVINEGLGTLTEGQSATIALNRALAESLLISPTRRALTVANLLASCLLLVASFLLTARRRTAIWWTTQALLANLLWSFAEAVGVFYMIGEARPSLLPIVEQSLASERAAGIAEGTDPAMLPTLDMAPAVLWSIAGVTAMMSLLMVIVYFIMLRVSRRDQVQAFLKPERPAA